MLSVPAKLRQRGPRRQLLRVGSRCAVSCLIVQMLLLRPDERGGASSPCLLLSGAATCWPVSRLGKGCRTTKLLHLNHLPWPGDGRLHLP